MAALDDPGGNVLEIVPGNGMKTAGFLRMATAVAVAVGEAHAAGIVHHDIRPANILFAEDGSVRLIGFGAASPGAGDTQDAAASMDDPGALPYMSPEQTGRMNRSTDARSDLYSLGIVFYQMLTGRLPFIANGALEWVHCHVARTPTPIAHHAPATPRQLIDIVDKLLAKSADDRYPTATALVADLRRCALEWTASGAIEPFALHQDDFVRRLVQPGRLYGRDDQLQMLLESHGRVASQGDSELMLISGASGVGKSSLVNEFQRHVADTPGHVASGKFEQNKKDIPYSTLAQSFRALLCAVLCLTDAEVDAWKKKLAAALGSNAALLTGLLPELEVLLGPMPAPADTSPTEAAARFHLAIRKFVAAFATEGRPLVLFIDDLQWLDAATLEVLEHLLTHEEVRNLMVIGAYRSNEVDDTHPLHAMIDKVRQTGLCITQIALAPLRESDVEHWIAAALKSQGASSAPLAALVHEKTSGNPFLALRLLRTLGEEGLIAFDRSGGTWTWDLSQIQASGHTQNIDDLMIDKLRRLPAAVRRSLELLSCFGSTASSECLTLASDAGLAELTANLSVAEEAGLIGRTSDGYRFAHDRIQEAAYALIPPTERAQRHLNIGRRLCLSMGPEALAANLFDIANQLASGGSLIANADERTTFSALFLQAGRRAKSETAYDSALNYLNWADGLLGDDRWTTHYDMAMATRLARAECEFLLGNLQLAERQLLELAAQAKGLIDKAAVTWLQVTLYTALDRSDLAIETCLAFLSAFGVHIPLHPVQEEVEREYDLLIEGIGPLGVSCLLALPVVESAERRAILDVLAAVLAPSFFSDENLVCLALCRMANLSLTYGNSDASALAYAYLGMVVGPRFGDYPIAFEFGKLGYDLVERGDQTRYRARVYMCFAYHVSAWARPLQQNLPLLRRAFDVARDNGDVTYAGFSSCTLVTTLLSSGDHLAAIQREGRQRLRYVTGVKFGLVADIMTVQLQLIASLRGETPVFGSFDDALFSEQAFEARLVANRNLDIATCWYWIRKAQARFFAGQYEEALQATELAEPLLWTSSGHFELAQHHLCGALIRAACWAAASPSQRTSLSDAIAGHLHQLRIWARQCPETFAMRVELVEAEVAKLEGRSSDAMQGYERALSAGRLVDSPQHMGLTLELASRFYRSIGLNGTAVAMMAQARDQYDRWGAHGKVRQLEAETPELRSTKAAAPVQQGSPLLALESIDAVAMLKTSQAVSGEVGLDKLMRALMVIALEHAGASRGLLILPKGDQLRIEAQADFNGSDVEVIVRARNVTAIELPMSVLHFVMRTQTTVLLDDARRAEHFASDPYIVASGCQSVLCLPLVRQGELIGVLYLENNLVTHVFTQSRVAILNLLASTAALSIENASLEEKESLLKEVHHRVKNNLQLISSLLSLQASRIQDPAVAELFAESRNRVRSMALVHENLYRAGNFARVPMPTHIRNLCAELGRAYGLAAQSIETIVEVDDVQLDLNRAVSCGLIINELVSNALKHAFRDRSEGRITVKLKKDIEGMVELSVADNGIGLPDGTDVSRAESLGLQLVDDLSAQLHGRLTVASAHPGTRFSILFATDDNGSHDDSEAAS